MVPWRTLAASLTTLGLAGAAAADDPRYPLFSPPGWYGPGPAGHGGAPGYYGWQYYGLTGGPHINPGVNRYGGLGGYGPYYWGIPSIVSGNWTNGLSAYGPPVPTYAPTPGAFGNVESSRVYGHNYLGTGFYAGGRFGGRHPGPPLGWAADAYNPSPWHAPRSVSVHAQPVVSAPSVELLAAPAATPEGAPCIRLTVVLAAADAQLWIEKTPTTAAGTERAFESPALEVGKRYEYELIARWVQDGRDHAETRKVSAAAGQALRVDFTRPAAEGEVAGR